MASQIPEKKKVSQAIKDEWAKIKAFGWKKGIDYVWFYYKHWILLAVLVPLAIVIVSSGNDMRQLVFHCSLSGEAFYDYYAYFEEFDTYAGFDTEAEYSHVDPMSNIDTTAGQNHVNWIRTEQLDMIVADADLNERTMRLGCFFDLTTYLPEDLLAELEDKLYYYENTELGIKGYYAVDVSEYFGYTADHETYGDGLYVCIPHNTLHPDKPIAFLRYLVECPPKDFVPAETP
ncbi:MAG: hypothetical protein IJC35_07225 [Oscillospiraceae bacterium]|nr:hypothetical protein [Oscillospiraceae bacterium]